LNISVVIPLYKPDYFFLNILIKSLKEQSYSDFEVIFSDDDDCEKLLNRCLIENDFSKYIYVKNFNNKKGIFSNLNNAIKYSKHDFIQILCQDDSLRQDFLFNQIELFIKFTDTGLVFSQFDLIDENNNLVQVNYLDHLNRLDMFLEKDKLAMLFFFYGCFIGNISPVMLTRKVYNNLGCFNENFAFASDFEYWVRFCNKYNLIFNKTNYLLVRNHSKRASIVLPSYTLLSERKIIYKDLFYKLKTKSFLLKFIYINYEIGSWNVYYTIRKNELNIKTFRELNSFPFSFFLSFFFLIFTINGKIKFKFKI
jgi:glycosyltransferase involved in cell wall biosynthesis